MVQKYSGDHKHAIFEYCFKHNIAFVEEVFALVTKGGSDEAYAKLPKIYVDSIEGWRAENVAEEQKVAPATAYTMLNLNAYATAKPINSFTSCSIVMDFEEEYTTFRIDKQTSSFALEIREKFINILKDIKEKCFISNYFISNQANRIAKYIYEKYKKKA